MSLVQYSAVSSKLKGRGQCGVGFHLGTEMSLTRNKIIADTESRYPGIKIRDQDGRFNRVVSYFATGTQ